MAMALAVVVSFTQIDATGLTVYAAEIGEDEAVASRAEFTETEEVTEDNAVNEVGVLHHGEEEVLQETYTADEYHIDTGTDMGMDVLVDDTRSTYNLAELDCSVWFDDLYGDGYTWFYTDEQTCDITLNTEELAGYEYETVWRVGICDEDGYFTSTVEPGTAYTIKEDGTGITLVPSELQKALNNSGNENFWCSVRAVIKVDEMEVAQADCGVEIRVPTYEYWLPVEDNVNQLPYWDYGISKSMNCHVNTAAYPDGGDVETEITDISVENAGDDEGEGDVVTVTEYDDGTGWNMHMERMGHAVGKITYNLADGSGQTAEKNFDIWVSGDVYNLDIRTEHGTDLVLPGDSINLTAEFWHDSYDEENGHYAGSTEGVTYEWGLEDENCADIARYVVNKDNPAVYQVFTDKDASVDRDIPIYVRVYMPGENGKEEVAYRNITLYVRNSYYNLEPLELNSDLAVGESTLIEPTLRWYAYEEGNRTEEEITDGITYRMEWDPNAVKITDASGSELTETNGYGTAPFTIKKLKNWDTDVTLIAELADENNNTYEVTRRSWHLNPQDYNAWFTDLRGGDYTWIYSDDNDADENESYELLLDTQNLSGRDYEIAWEVGICGDDGNYTQRIASTEENGNVASWTENKDSEQPGIILDAAGMKAALKKATGEDELDGFSVRAIIMSGGEEVSRADTWVGFRTPVYNLEEGDGDILLGASFIYENAKIHCWVENKDYPYGEDVELELADVVISNESSENEGEKVFLTSSENGATVITANAYGEADITYKTTHETLGERNFTVHMYVVEDVYRLYAWSSTGTTCLFPGTSLILEYEVTHGHYDEATGEHFWETEQDYTIDYPNNDENTLVSIDAASGTVTAGMEYGDAYINIRASVPVGEEGDVYECWSGMDLHVTDSYYQATVADSTVAPGERAVPSITLQHLTEDNQTGNRETEFYYQIETSENDSDLVMIDASGTAVQILEDVVTQEDDPRDVRLNIVVTKTDDNGNEVRCDAEWNVRVCEHVYETVTTPSTCTKKGSKVSTCTKCGTRKTEELSLAEHTVVIDAAVASTCSKTGLTEGSHCSVCHKVIKSQETVAKKEHKFETITTKATTTENGSVIRKCSVCGETEHVTTIYSPKTVKLAKTSYTYDGKAKKPKVTVKDSSGNTISSSNYSVSYSSNKKIGQATVKVTFTGNYSGTLKATFTIKPKTTSISGISAAKKGFTVKWKKQTSQTNGYEIQYSTSSKFAKKNTKTVTVKSNKTTSKKISKLSAKKKYYVRIRTYKTVKINGKSTKIYSDWSKVKKITTKK